MSEVGRQAGSRARLAPLGLLLALVVAYAGTLSGPFVWDDLDGIVANPSIRSLWPPWGPLLPPADGKPVGGRPIPNWSLALTHALAGLEPAAYRGGNWLLHAGSALLLLGALRRTFASPLLPGPLRAAAAPLASASALLWALHPLCSEVVLYAMQRTEACLGFFLLLTFHAALRAREAGDGRARRGWSALALVACTLGMASKAVMVMAPPLLLLHDRAFGAGSLRAALARRGRLYAALFASIAVSLALQLGAPRGRSVVWGEPDYLAAQVAVVAHYLRLAFWPDRLVFDYGPLLPERALIDPGAAALLALLLGTGALLAVRAPRLGYAPAWVFGLLAPTSTLAAVLTEVGAERRMYLPLAGLVPCVAAGGFLLGRRALARLGAGEAARAALAGVLVAALALGCVARTRLRARDYASAEALWRSSIAALPENPRAHYELGNALRARGRLDAALAAYRDSLAAGESARAHGNLGATLAARGELAAARPHLERAAALEPDSAEARANLGFARLLAGEAAAAVPELERAVALAPEQPSHRLTLARAQLEAGRPAAALRTLEQVLARAPEHPVAGRLAASLRARLAGPSP